MSISVLTLVKGRDEHLKNLMRALALQTVKPDELIIVFMQDNPIVNLPKLNFTVKTHHLSADPLPLAAARNLAAAQASSEYLIFLDVDCIPSPTCISQYLFALDQFHGVIMGDVRYLPKMSIEQPFDWKQLHERSVHHSERRKPPEQGLEPCDDFRCFWSLSFAMPKRIFEISGGFDEDYVGYGAEDTDFGKKLSVQQISIAWCAGATVYHQFHTQHMPPVHQVSSILHNNRVYKRKWGTNTMEHWLGAFIGLGLIETTSDGDYVQLRSVNAEDLKITRQIDNMPYASTADFMKRHSELSPG